MKQLNLFFAEKTKNKHLIRKTYQSRRHSTRTNKRKRFRTKQEYYQSEEWEKFRKIAIHNADYACQRCGAPGVLQVHHLTYDNLYKENLDDVEVLCKRCHKRADRDREDETMYQNGLDTFLEKKYGGNVDYFEGCEQEYDAWLEKTQYRR